MNDQAVKGTMQVQTQTLVLQMLHEHGLEEVKRRFGGIATGPSLLRIANGLPVRVATMHMVASALGVVSQPKLAAIATNPKAE